MNVAHLPLLPDVFEGRESLVVLAPHPDDESLGCGALLARGFAGAGAHVICLMAVRATPDLANGRPGGWPASDVRRW